MASPCGPCSLPRQGRADKACGPAATRGGGGPPARPPPPPTATLPAHKGAAWDSIGSWGVGRPELARA